MVATVGTLTLAADFCPPGSEVFAFAILMSISNLATSLADIVGSFLYEHLFASRLASLIIVSALFTAFALVLVPLLRLGNKQQGEPVGVMRDAP
jgi:predicted MFS family arabinose efflux permease